MFTENAYTFSKKEVKNEMFNVLCFKEGGSYLRLLEGEIINRIKA